MPCIFPHDWLVLARTFLKDKTGQKLNQHPHNLRYTFSRKTCNSCCSRATQWQKAAFHTGGPNYRGHSHSCLGMLQVHRGKLGFDPVLSFESHTLGCLGLFLSLAAANAFWSSLPEHYWDVSTSSCYFSLSKCNIPSCIFTTNKCNTGNGSEDMWR